MKIYHYKKQTGEYLSEGVAQPSPLDKTFLIPAQATKSKPPNHKNGFARCFINNKWVQVVDNRNQIKYIDEDKVVFNLGDEITPSMTDEPNPPIPSLIEKIAETRRQYDKAIQKVCTAHLFNDINSARNLATLAVSPLQAIAQKITNWELEQQAIFIKLLDDAKNDIIQINASTFDENFIQFNLEEIGHE